MSNSPMHDAFFEGYDACQNVIQQAERNVGRRLPMNYGIKPVESGYKDIDVNVLIRKWAAELERVYEEQTAGSYTFDGILGEFLREVTGQKTVTGR